MKKLVFILSLVFTSCLFGGDVIDRAHLLGSSVQRLQSDVASLPVWIETYDSVANDDIKSYATNRIRQLTNDHGFIIVVTTHPRAWRISMYPEGFVGGEATRQIGDEMASRFKRGEFYPALREASTSFVGC